MFGNSNYFEVIITRSCSSGSDKIEGNVLLLDNKSFVQRRLHHFHELRIVKIVDDVFKNVAIGDEAESSEYDHDRDLLLDVGEDADDPLTDGRLLEVLTSPGQHVHPEGRGRPRRVLKARSNLCLVCVLAVLHGEDVNRVGGHFLLSDQNLL